MGYIGSASWTVTRGRDASRWRLYDVVGRPDIAVVFVATTASLLSTRVRESVANRSQDRRTQRKPR
jgi:hypothetical protein